MLSKCIVLAVVLICCNAVSQNDLNAWNNYKQKFSKSYDSSDDETRHMNAFLANKQKIDVNNEENDNGDSSYRMELNKYSDLTHDDFIKNMKGYKRLIDEDGDNGGSYYFGEPDYNDDELPASFDWRDEGAMTKVKDQGSECGACWAFTSAAAMESQQLLKNGIVTSISEQNLIDCTSKYDGCADGGYPEDAFRYVFQSGGISSEKDYPFRADDGSCKGNFNSSGVTIHGYVKIPSGDKSALMGAIYTVGPIAVAIDASDDSFLSYSSGLYHPKKCGNTIDDLDHTVLLVGWGEDYYIFKNSYGTSWGDEGYGKIFRDGNNFCGVATAATYPVL